MFFFRAGNILLFFLFFPGGKWFNVKFKGGREMDGKQKLQTATQFPLWICQITTQKSNTSHKTSDGRPPQ